MVEAPKLPPIWIVAALAARPKAALVVGIIVALAACLGRALVVLRDVTALAGHGRMQANQRKGGKVVIEFCLPPPARLVVALLALRPKLPFVGIGRFVAADAGGRQLVVQVAGMARRAVGLAVRSAKRKLRLLVMIEPHGGPLRGRVAALALWPVPACVLVLEPVAGNAGNA